MKVLVIGMNPSKQGRVGAKENSTVKKLHEWMTDLGVKHFSFSNSYEHTTDKIPLSQINYDRLFTLTQNYGKIIALGNFASEALDKINVSHFKLPHPSPLNRQLNDKNFERHVLENCRNYLR